MGAQGPEQEKEPRYQVNYHMYQSGGRLSYTPSIECVVGLTIHETQLVRFRNVHHFLIASCSREKDIPGSHRFPYCKPQKAHAENYTHG